MLCSVLTANPGEHGKEHAVEDRSVQREREHPHVWDERVPGLGYVSVPLLLSPANVSFAVVQRFFSGPSRRRQV